MRTRKGGDQKSENFADVINGCSLSLGPFRSIGDYLDVRALRVAAERMDELLDLLARYLAVHVPVEESESVHDFPVHQVGQLATGVPGAR